MRILGRMTWYKFIIMLIAGYFAISLVSKATANFMLAVVLAGFIPFLILRYFMLDSLYKQSINIVDSKYVLNKNALHNDHCTVIYTPDEKIVVMENIADRKHKKHMFTLTKNSLNVNKAWNRLCRIFDSFTNLYSLEEFYNYDIKVQVVAIEAPKEEKPEVKIQKSDNSVKFSDFAAIQPDSYAKDANKQVEDTGNYINIDGMKEQKPFMPKQTKQEVEVVEISGLKKQDEYVPKEEKEQDPVNLDGMQKIDKYVEHDAPEQELVGIDVLADKNLNKINVNAVEATELALLPGINIVIAKKIIEHRNKNGNFKTIEEFIKIANLKEHFIPKIRAMIEIGQSKFYDESSQDYEQGRIVDL